jgi:hypothetical protein
MGRHVVRSRDEKGSLSGENLEWKNPHRSSKFRWDSDIKMGLEEI